MEGCGTISFALRAVSLCRTDWLWNDGSGDDGRRTMVSDWERATRLPMPFGRTVPRRGPCAEAIAPNGTSAVLVCLTAEHEQQLSTRPQTWRNVMRYHGLMVGHPHAPTVALCLTQLTRRCKSGASKDHQPNCDSSLAASPRALLCRRHGYAPHWLPRYALPSLPFHSLLTSHQAGFVSSLPGRGSTGDVQLMMPGG